MKMTRREFFRSAAAVSATVAMPWRVSAVAPSNRITIGLIGIGAMGRGHLGLLLGHPAVQLLAVCDVDRVRCDAAKQQANCAGYNDCRDLLARTDIDAVVIVTPDHWHSLLAIEAAKAGKDVYCEKPVSLTIREGRRMVETMRRYCRVFQTGTQYRSIPTIRRVCEFVRAGGLGKVKSVFTIWGKTSGSFVLGDPPLDAEPVPEGLDWNLWVGPASWRPYNHAYHRNPVSGVVPWVFCDAFGAGPSTSYHSHAVDVIQYALGVERSGPVEIIHPSSGWFPTLTYRYANGTLLHLVEGWSQVHDVYHAVPASARLEGNFGGVFVGERGWLTSMYGGGPIEGGPETIFDEIKLATREVNFSAESSHHTNWFDCIRSRLQPSADEEIGHRSASLGHLTIIAYKLGRSLKWDPVGENFIGDDEANRLLSRAMREPWQL